MTGSKQFEFDREDFRSAAYFALTTGLCAMFAYFGLTPPEELKAMWPEVLTALPVVVGFLRGAFRWWSGERKG